MVKLPAMTVTRFVPPDRICSSMRCLGAVAERHERDDGRDADDHAEHGQGRAHLVARERLERDAGGHDRRHRCSLESMKSRDYNLQELGLQRHAMAGIEASSVSALRLFVTGMIADDAAVAEGDDARGVFGDVVLVRDQEHGDALLVFSRWKMPITSTLVRESRLPVGSSASRSDG